MSTFSQRLRSRNLPWFGGRRIILCDPGGGVMRGGNQIRMKSADRRKPRYERQWNAAFGRPPARSKVQGAFNSMRLGLSQLEGNTFCEDRYAFDELYANGSSVFFVSVIDGHGGWQVAHFLERELLQQVRKRMFGEDARGKSGSYFSPHNITSDSEEKGGYFFGLGKKGSPGESTPVADAGAIQFDSIVPTAVDAQGIGRVLTEAYNEADETLKARISASVQLGFDRFVRLGACVITCAITDGHYVVANAGDCKALLCRGGKAVPLSRLHNLNMPEERERLRQERPNEKDLVQCVHAWKDPATSRLYERPGPGLEKIETACYVKGVLQPTRAFGDFALKSADLNITLGSFPGSGSKSVYARPVVNGADFSKGPYITAAPEVRIVPREAGDEFVIVASDGLYDLLSDDEIVEVARAAGNPELAAGALTEAAKLRALEELGLSAKEYESLTPGDRRDVHDDVTVGVFYLEFPDPWRQKISRVSEQLQSVCDEVLKSAGSNLKNGKGSMGMQEFSVCIADPSLEDCPLVAVSKGFERLTGYRVEDCVGRNCRFLNYGVPQEKLDNETASRLRAFTDVAVSGDPLAVAGANVAPPRWAQDVIGGGAYFLRWNRTRSGELFQNLFLLRQIWAEDRTYLIALQTKLEGDIEKVGGSILEELNASCDMLSRAITRRMTGLEQVLHPYPDHGEEPPKLKEVMRKFRKKTKSNATR
ncbi:unnamed protein product [Amoebophrya sp. A25]|nr:unnamed protein product [Amoebophrya sp. A25]|eukprot:GSA25T00021660001.1